MSLKDEPPRVIEIMVGMGWEWLGDGYYQANGAAIQASEGSEWYLDDLRWARELVAEDVQTLNTSPGEEDAERNPERR